MIAGIVAAGAAQVTPEDTETYPTWDPSAKDTDIILSNGNMDAETNEPSGGGSVLVTQAKNSGKYYFEIAPVQLYATNPGFLTGLMRGTTDLATFIGASTNSWGIASNSGNSQTWFNGSSANTVTDGVSSLSAYHKCAVDLDNGRIWFGISNRSSGAWIGGGDPAAGTSPTFTYTPNSTALRIAGCPRRGDASNASNRNKLRLRVHPDDWEGTPPSGFGAWSDAGETPETVVQAVYTTPTPDGTDSSIPSGVLNEIGGDLDIEWTGIARWDLQENSSAFTAWSLDDGDQRLRFGGGENGNWILTINGSDVLTATMITTSAAAGQRAMQDQLIQVRAWRVGTEAGIRVLVNGVAAYDKTATVSSTAIPTPSTGYLNSVSGGSPYADIDQVLFTSYGPGASRTPSFVGCVLGDSTIASYDEDSGVPTPSLLRSGGICKNEFIKCLAIGGATIAEQETAWDNFSQKSDLRWIIIQVGLNDIDPSEAASLAIGRLQDLVDAVNLTKPAGCLVYIATMIPCYERMVTRYGVGSPADNSYAKWQAMNEAIRGEGSTPITGVDGRISSHTTDMDDGSGNLAALYDSGDGIHPNNVGRQVIADAWLETVPVEV